MLGCFFNGTVKGLPADGEGGPNGMERVVLEPARG